MWSTPVNPSDVTPTILAFDAVQPDGGAQHGGTRIKLAHPEVVAQNYHCIPSYGLIFGLQKRSPLARAERPAYLKEIP